MAKEATQETTAVAARGFLIWGEEFSRKGRYAAAEKLYQRAWGLVERTLGHKHPMMAEVLECYSDLLIRTNRSAEGTAMRRRSEAIWRLTVPGFVEPTSRATLFLGTAQREKALIDTRSESICPTGWPLTRRYLNVLSRRTLA